MGSFHLLGPKLSASSAPCTHPHEWGPACDMDDIYLLWGSCHVISPVSRERLVGLGKRIGTKGSWISLLLLQQQVTDEINTPLWGRRGRCKQRNTKRQTTEASGCFIISMTSSAKGELPFVTIITTRYTRGSFNLLHCWPCTVVLVFNK